MIKEDKQTNNKHEIQKLGRYASYYKIGRIPMFFRSLREAQAMGNFQKKFILDWANSKNISEKSLNKTTPQIRLIPKNQISDYLKSKFDIISTKEKRNEIDRELSKNSSKKQIFFDSIQSNLIAVDWAEQTYNIRVDIDQDILDWIKRNI